MYDWSGTVPARLEQGQPTGLILKAGDVISIVAKGWVKYGYPDNYWAAPQGTLPKKPTLNDTLIAKIGNKTYGIGNGVLHKTVPVDGELILLFNDKPGSFGDNSGEFHVVIKIESRYDPDYLEEII
ncbi:lectin [Xenorhabdus nematophila]|uniref:PA-I galactophilic lectin (PA-IL) (Galactose-binding lectin) n=1 Tax=Xenorhabdus nematophila (strain ATCC 19061 / DSM 3370 / CCUG 14189 / LMG 1036 / NCIMB 9965 / AN6) TaxID=406817 RepID=D3VE08_XENNA|nr:LecA/PA-IL family lectin [Xenorhabdus nematophila]CEE93489.1 PA-I galactophilic lectin (PA-IL) (Galactose-binding lectin) [Xenorhabdus nematophila str. Anatoliense]CEF30452.1 PA-I galactophilic lectin (PA-IL) (Galactose-binding lectin) [Xenorhabdus nematophila str. Websteri]AYA40393.1 lectin [Xenorhabdus nematophila]KHD27121.1 lectin [Xenorhabdus nematophila]MBA0019068.1 lectin [Xenorhabdus nematophila]